MIADYLWDFRQGIFESALIRTIRSKLQPSIGVKVL
jgi:hypothetical protein